MGKCKGAAVSASGRVWAVGASLMPDLVVKKPGSVLVVDVTVRFEEGVLFAGWGSGDVCGLDVTGLGLGTSG